MRYIPSWAAAFGLDKVLLGELRFAAYAMNIAGSLALIVYIDLRAPEKTNCRLENRRGSLQAGFCRQVAASCALFGSALLHSRRVLYALEL